MTGNWKQGGTFPEWPLAFFLEDGPEKVVREWNDYIGKKRRQTDLGQDSVSRSS